MRKRYNFANHYGFSAQQKMTLIPPMISALDSLGLEVWEPFVRNNQENFLEPGWAYRIGQKDFADVRVDSGRGQDRTLRGKAPVECAIDGWS